MKRFFFTSAIFHLFNLFLLIGFLLILSSSPFQSVTVRNTVLLDGFCYVVIATILPQIARFLLVERKYYIFPITVLIYTFVFALSTVFYVDFSRYLVFYGLIFTLVVLYATALLRTEHAKLKLKAINNFDLNRFDGHKMLEITELEAPYRCEDVENGLVVNLRGDLSVEDQKFIANCSIKHIPVFNIAALQEMVEGRVQVDHLAINSNGTLQVNPAYMFFKRLWESLLILATFPVTLPIMLITVILIKLENPGPAMFIQDRVGQGGKLFRIYKFRSMTVKSQNAEDKFATQEQARITKVGRVIRKVRIDELPQLFNVLIGNMALIGPRPEQASFVKQFEEEIPFYSYRHIVKPGITGWAQTVQGYADDAESTKVKLSYDLYYIKHLSIWLDANIVFKTIRTMLTGFGAK